MPIKDPEIRKAAQRNSMKRKRARERTGEQNPIICLRERLGMDRPTFARLLGIEYKSLSEIERGYKPTIPGRFVAALSDIPGVNVSQIEEEYFVWQETTRVALLKALVTRDGGTDGQPTTQKVVGDAR